MLMTDVKVNKRIHYHTKKYKLVKANNEVR